MFSTVTSAALCGIQAEKVTVETDVSDGLPLITLVGDLSSKVREAKDRARTAIHNEGFRFPVKRVTINLSPADMHKDGTGFDLPIAISILVSYGLIPQESLDGVMMAGELGLDGRIRPVRGILQTAECAKRSGCHTCIVPVENLQEGSAVKDICVLGADSLHRTIAFLRGEGTLKKKAFNIEEIQQSQKKRVLEDFADVKGQETVRRAAEVAVAGMHNLLIIGPPGAGKTMIARRIPSILPQMTREEMLEVSRIHSAAGLLPPDEGFLTVRPFRSPHQTATAASLAGGGAEPRPGEVSLAHRGVLYLDELPEFNPKVLEILRGPLEDHTITIARNALTVQFPADFMLVASMNPCRCGYYPDRRLCRCTPRQIRQYLSHVSQPLLDRIDICVHAQEVDYKSLSSAEKGESSSEIRARVEKVRQIQAERYKGEVWNYNSGLTASAIQKYCPLGTEEDRYMKLVFEDKKLTGRSYSRILKVARTIADLSGESRIRTEHLAEAVQYRALEKRYWAGEEN